MKAAVYTENGELDYKTLKEIQPYHWAHAYPDANQEVPHAKNN